MVDAEASVAVWGSNFSGGILYANTAIPVPSPTTGVGASGAKVGTDVGGTDVAAGAVVGAACGPQPANHTVAALPPAIDKNSRLLILLTIFLQSDILPPLRLMVMEIATDTSARLSPPSSLILERDDHSAGFEACSSLSW